jgi:predicted nucleic acid-binding protein
MRLLLEEPGAEDLQRILEGDEPVALPFMALMEVRYVLLRSLPPERVGQIVAMLRASAEVQESDVVWGEMAALVKSGGGLSLGDAWMASLALLRNATLVHRDPEFDRVAGLQSFWLGPAPATTR